MSDEETTPDEQAESKQEWVPVPVLQHLNDDLPRFYVYDDKLHARDLDAAVPLSAPRSVIRAMQDLPLSEQFDLLLQFHDEHLAELHDTWDGIDGREFARKWFQAYAAKEEARLGESLRSSAS